MTADMRALIWIVGATAMIVGALLIGWQLVLIAGGYLLTNWSRR